MVTLSAHLTALSHYTLRGIATRLKLRHYQQHRKPDWIDAITSSWQQPTQQSHWLALLSPAAQAALHRLLLAQQIPAALFWATYGPVRQVTAKQQWQPPPWQTPATVSEELYYTALLAPTVEPNGQRGSRPSLARAQWLTIPAELQALFAPADKVTLSTDPLSTDPLPTDPLPSDPLPSDPLLTDPLPSDPLLHDLAHFLIYLHSQPELHLQQGRWLTRPHLAALNQRLRRPLTSQPLPTHRHNTDLRLLAFLAAAGELCDQGRLTPTGWTWLAAAAHPQLAWLWQSWCQATPAQRQAYHLPAATVSLPWPQPLIQQLYSIPAATPFTVADLVHDLFRCGRASHTFWATNFHDLADLEQLLSQTLTEVLQPLGIVEPLPAQHYQITPSGARLLHNYPPPPAGGQVAHHPSSPRPIPPLTPASLTPASLTPDPPSASLLDTDPLTPGFYLDLPCWPSAGAAQAHLAAYAHYSPPPARSPQRYHRYQLTPTSLARAAAIGHALPNLYAALTSLGYLLTPEQTQQLHSWHAAGQQLTLTHLPLLRTQTAAQLAALAQERTVRPFLSEILAPTVAVVNTDLPTVAHHLAQQGYHATQPAALPAVPPPHLPQRPTTDPVPPPAWFGAGGAAALWLAGRLYAQLAAHLPLPLPPPFAELDRLLASLSPAQQAVLQAQAAQLHDQLLQLLDNFPFTPPPQPTDPAHWRPLLNQAIVAGHRLQLTYFSAGRNLTTQRLIEPYWLEERRHTPYLRAYCHSAGRVLTFRLDRIVALTVAA